MPERKVPRLFRPSIYEKLHVHTKSEAVSRALRGRLMP
jgi:hypothetical protein